MYGAMEEKDDKQKEKEMKKGSREMMQIGCDGAASLAVSPSVVKAQAPSVLS